MYMHVYIYIYIVYYCIVYIDSNIPQYTFPLKVQIVQP